MILWKMRVDVPWSRDDPVTSDLAVVTAYIIHCSLRTLNRSEYHPL